MRAAGAGRRALRGWVAANATHVDLGSIAQAAAADVEQLSWMDPIVDGRRFVFVGEGNHFIHEKNPYRLFVTRYLASRGFNVLLEELAWSDGLRLDRYLRDGDAQWLARVGTFGYEGDRRVDRDDRPTGYLAQGRDTYPSAAFAHEHGEWLDGLRAIESPRPGCPLRLHGFDVDYEPGAGYVHLREHLDELPLDDLPLRSRERIGAHCTVPPGESLDDEITRVAALVELLEATFGGDAPVVRTARSLRDGFRYVRMIQHADLEGLRPGMAFRERVMHAQVDHLVDTAADDDRFIVFAHDLHLARDDGAVERPGAAVGPGGDRVDSIGMHLARRHPGSVATIWMLDFEGRDAQPLASLGNEVRSGRRTLNATLAEVGDGFFVPVDGDAFTQRWAVAMMYGHTVTLDVRTQADALYFRRHVTPLREPA